MEKNGRYPNQELSGHKKNKNIKEEVLKNEQQYRRIFECSPEVIGIVDGQGNVLDVTRRLYDWLGYKPEEIIGKNFMELPLLSEESKSLLERNLHQMILGEDEPVYELTFVTKKGEKCMGQVLSNPIRDEKGRLKKLLVMARDISERKQAEEALKQAEKDYRGLFENAHDAIFVFAPENEIILNVNPRACEMYGFTRDEFLGMSLEDISKDVALGKTRIKKALEEGAFHSFETVHYKKDGSEIYLEINAAVVDYKGQKAILSINRDISDRKKAEEKLRLEKAHLDQLFESAQEGIVMADREGKILSVNSEFTRLFGYDRDDLLGRNVDEQVMPRKEFLEGHSITKKVAEGENVNFEAIRQRRDGSLIHVSVLGSPIIVDGQVIAIYAIYRDITERKRSEEKIKASLREREVMLREIHHRVKNNMQIISSLLRLQSKQIKNKKILDIFNVGQDRIRSMALIHESLYQSKDLSRINFADYIERLTTHLFSMYRIGMERVQLKVNVNKVFLNINQAIPCGLIVNELVSNSLKHAFPNGQEGEISVRMNGNNWGKTSLIVKDNGVGFPEDLDFQNTETLGMQLVTDLVSQIEGNIELSREKGTEFKIAF